MRCKSGEQCHPSPKPETVMLSLMFQPSLFFIDGDDAPNTRESHQLSLWLS